MSGAAQQVKVQQDDEHARRPARVRGRRFGDVALLRLTLPPVNTLTREMRSDLMVAIDAAEHDPEVKAIVLGGEGTSFCTGFPPDALFAQDPEPSLNTVCDRIEACSKPVIVALHGSTLEAGLALALAAHYRVMGALARIGAPEITVGLVPTGGVTQRLPRLIGAGPALDLLLSGRPIPALEARKLGLVDEVSQQKPIDAAIELAERLIAEGKGPRPSRDVTRGFADGARYMHETMTRRAEMKDARGGAFEQIIDCVDAALIMPFDAGVARETVARADCFDSEASQALRHAFFSERRAGRLLGVESGVRPKEVTTLGLVGAGPMALGIAMTALDHGIKVHLVGQTADQLVMVEQKINAAYLRAEQQGQITEEVRNARLADFTASTSASGLSEAELVLDATTASTEARARLLLRLEEFLPEDTVLATVAEHGFSQMAQELAHPERFLGLHFFTPSQAIRVVELARCDGISDQALATAHAFVKRIGKLPVTVRARDGLIATVVQDAAWSAVDVLLLMGARPSRIDRVMRHYGFPAGPCEIMDALGLEHVSGGVAEFFASEGRKGKVSGQGFYDYHDGQAPDDAASEAILADLRRQGGVPVLALTDRSISDRILLAQANAGARLLQAGTVTHPVDIDVVMMLAKGYPRNHGGPMKAADLMGILQAEKRLRSFADAAPDIWEPATIWRELSKNGDNFEKLNLL